MSKLTTLLLICCIIIASCKQKESQICDQYLPKVSQLEKGLVWKYYVHVEQEHGHPWTNIMYTKIIKVDDTLTVSAYNGAFQQIKETYYLIEDDKWKTLKQSMFNTRTEEEYPSKISDTNVSIDWLNNNAKSVATTKYPSTNLTLTKEQNSVSDTLYNGAKCVKIEDIVTYTYESKSDTSRYIINNTSLYQPSLGRVAGISKSDKRTSKYELDELMTLAEFEKRANHGLHRVGYIDTTNVMDKNNNFSICHHFNNIHDYYNDDDAQFLGGKGRLWTVLEQKLDKSLLKGQSGYLSYHFVINCDGKAGWFTTVECDLNHTPNEFSNALKQHLFDILSEEKEWKPLINRGEKKDAYTYITFKIKDGELIELLP